MIKFPADFPYSPLRIVVFLLRAFCVWCADDDELADLGRGIGLSSRRMVYVPINNAEGRLSRGTHWCDSKKAYRRKQVCFDSDTVYFGEKYGVYVIAAVRKTKH